MIPKRNKYQKLTAPEMADHILDLLDRATNNCSIWAHTYKKLVRDLRQFRKINTYRPKRTTNPQK